MKNLGTLSIQDKLLLVSYVGISVAYGIIIALKVRSIMSGKH
jgi:hypothetical protein